MHLTKVDFSIDFTGDGIVISFSLMQPSNAFSPISVMKAGNVNCDSDEHPLNALLPIDVTDVGMIISVIDKQPSKALDPIDVTPKGIEICVIFIHPLNVFGPITIPGCSNKRSTILLLFLIAARCNAVT